nr:hypothetical protein [uncultured Mucilaginibacter sp.]
MKALLYITCIVLIVGCRGKVNHTAIDSVPKLQASRVDTTSKSAVFKPYKLIDGFIATDTGYADAVVIGGTYAVVFRNGALLDTIEKGFGIRKVIDGMYFFQVVKSAKADEEELQSSPAGYTKTISATFAEYKLLTGGKKQDFSTLAPNFSDYFSSPYVIKNKIYYWQIKKIDTAGNNSISAAEYNPVTKKTISHYLFNDDIGSDDSGYFWYPYLKKDTIYFQDGKEKVSKFSKEFKPYN